MSTIRNLDRKLLTTQNALRQLSAEVRFLKNKLANVIKDETAIVQTVPAVAGFFEDDERLGFGNVISNPVAFMEWDTDSSFLAEDTFTIRTSGVSGAVADRRFHVFGQTIINSGNGDDWPILLIKQGAAHDSLGTSNMLEFEKASGASGPLVFDNDGRLNNLSGTTEPFELRSRTVNPGVSSFDLIQTSGGSATDWHTRFIDSTGATIGGITEDGNLKFPLTGASAYAPCIFFESSLFSDADRPSVPTGQGAGCLFLSKSDIITTVPRGTLFLDKGGGTVVNLETGNVIQNVGSDLPFQPNLNFEGGLQGVNDPINGAIDVSVKTDEPFAWTGSHSFSTEVTHSSGALLSEVADGAGVDAFAMNNAETLTEGVDRYLLTLQRDGVDKLNVTTSGAIWSRDGLAVGIDPTVTISSDLLFSYLFKRFDDSTSGTHQCFTYDTRAAPPVGMTGGPTYYSHFAVMKAEESAFTGNPGDLAAMVGEYQHDAATWGNVFGAYGIYGRLIFSSSRASQTPITSAAAVNGYYQQTGSNQTFNTIVAALRAQAPFDTGTSNTVPRYTGLMIEDQSAATCTSGPDSIYVASQGGASATVGNAVMAGGGWNNGHIVLGSGHLWNDGGTPRWKSSAPTGTSDGTDLTSGGGGGGDSYLEWAAL